jgi:transposase
MIFLPFPSVHLEHLTVTEEGITALVSVSAESGSCPDCQSPSSRVHSRYQRTVKDLPASGLAVQLKLQVRRFFCDNPFCSRKTFAQAMPEVTLRYVRKTLRLIEMLRELAFALGGEGGARLASVLKTACSADTFLRLIRRTRLSVHDTPTHLGVDDWAFRCNVSYGTILVDLQDHQVVDLLADRTASSLENWFKSHPGVELISRDRSGDYAAGASRGAPQALQVADRFHLQKNLAEALERIFHRHHQALQQIRVAHSKSSPVPVATTIPRAERAGQREQSRSKRMQRYEAVRQLYLQGISLSEIARRFRMGRMRAPSPSSGSFHEMCG